MRFAAVLLVVLGVATAAAQTCVSSWPQFEVTYVAEVGSAPWNDPADAWHHTRMHQTNWNAQLAGTEGRGEYFDSFMSVLQSTFGWEYAYVAEQMGVVGFSEVWMAKGLSALDDFVDFDEPIEIGLDASGPFCANLYSITDGSHEGEFLLVVRDQKTGHIKHWEVAPTEDVGRARAHDIIKDLEKVMLDPDGCGDMRVGEGC